MKLKHIIAASAVLACATAAQAQSAGDFMLNGGWTYIMPKGKSSLFHSVSVSGAPPVDLSGYANASVKGEAASTFGLSGTYFITDNFAGELALNAPARIGLKGQNNFANAGKIASIEQFNPALLLKYYFLNPEDKFRPFVGVGVSRVWFKKARIEGSNASFTSIDVKNEWAPEATIGAHYLFDDHFSIGISASYMRLEPTLTTRIPGAVSTDKLKLNPITTFVNIGYKF